MKPKSVRPKIGIIFLVAMAFAVAGCMRWGEDKDEPSLNASFKEVIGLEAPTGVTNKRSSHYWVRDSYVKWLCFTCDEQTLATIRSLGKAHPKSSAYIWSHDDPGVRNGTNPNAPKWWTEAAVGSDLEQIELVRSKSDYGRDVTYIWIDRKARIVYALREVID